jgi:hypothetical protein
VAPDDAGFEVSILIDLSRLAVSGEHERHGAKRYHRQVVNLRAPCSAAPIHQRDVAQGIWLNHHIAGLSIPVNQPPPSRLERANGAS